MGGEEAVCRFADDWYATNKPKWADLPRSSARYKSGYEKIEIDVHLQPETPEAQAESSVLHDNFDKAVAYKIKELRNAGWKARTKREAEITSRARRAEIVALVSVVISLLALFKS
jgi:hypothetical protein